MIPLFVDCSHRRIVIFGGGEVALRKAAFFLPESKVTVVSRSFREEFNDMAVDRIELDVKAAFNDNIEEVIGGAFLVVSALSDLGQNNRIGGLCRAQGILFNNADGEPGDVIIPSVTKGANYTIAISTGGKSPAVSQFVREKLDSVCPGLDAMIALQAELRESLKLSEYSQPERSEILRKILQDKKIWALACDDFEAARKRAKEKYFT